MQTNIKINVDNEVNDVVEIVKGCRRADVSEEIEMENELVQPVVENIKIEFVEEVEESEMVNASLKSDSFVNGQKQKRDSIADIIEREKQKNKNEIWSKIDKMSKIQKLKDFADKYGKEQGYSVKDIKTLKTFFVSALDRGKLTKTKDLVYNKEKHEIISIPSLTFDNHNFTIKNVEPIAKVKGTGTLKIRKTGATL